MGWIKRDEGHVRIIDNVEEGAYEYWTSWNDLGGPDMAITLHWKGEGYYAGGSVLNLVALRDDPEKMEKMNRLNARSFYYVQSRGTKDFCIRELAPPNERNRGAVNNGYRDSGCMGNSDDGSMAGWQPVGPWDYSRDPHYHQH